MTGPSLATLTLHEDISTTADGGHMSEAINLGEKLEVFDQHWQPKIVAHINDYDVRIVKVKGEFVWHNRRNRRLLPRPQRASHDPVTRPRHRA
jgi:hypothetical protein